MSRQQQPVVAGVSRRKLAALLGLHPDSLSRLMPEGLAIAVAAWGGRGKTQLFDVERAGRFVRAWRCRQLRSGCPACWLVLEDCQAVAEHLIETRHPYAGCEDCTPPGGLCQPCR